MECGGTSQNQPTGLFVGLCTVDVAYVVTSFPSPNQKIAAQRQELAAGGPATNAAVTFSFLGGTAHLVTALGMHPLTSIVRQDLDHRKVEITDVAPGHPEAPPLSSIFVHAETGERTVVSANAAAYSGLQYRFDTSWLSGISILLVDGHHMPLCIAAATAAREAGVPVVLDGGSWKNGMPTLLAQVDMAVCSGDFTPPERTPGRDTVRFLREAGIAVVAITRGSDSILWQSGDGGGEIPVPRIKPRDTLGAGDIFHGAFCWALASSCDLETSLLAAAEVAAESCLHFGTRGWMDAFDAGRLAGGSTNPTAFSEGRLT